MNVSKKLIEAIKLSSTPAYKIAWSAGVNPTTLSKLINAIEKPKPEDQRIINVGKILGIPPEECFQEDQQ
jgi:lambda repressor-like predicted transcriptional regulator